MKKSDELRIQTRRLIAKNLIILVVLAVVAFVGASSWMTDATTADAKGISAKTQVVDGLEYYIMPPADKDQYEDINKRLRDNAAYNEENKNKEGFVEKNTSWHKGSLTFDFKDPEFKFMEDLFLCEVTGDGKTFTIPKLMQYGEIAYVDRDSDFDEAVANENYMSFDIYFRSQNQHDVEMMSSSSIAPKGIIDSTEEGMKNAAIGAVRMSVLNGNNRELLWIPGPCVWYEALYNKGEGRLNTNLTGFANKGSVYYNGTELVYTTEATTDHAYYNNTSKTRTVISDNVTASTANNYKLGKDVVLVSLDNADKANNGYYYGHVRINLWVEGEDSEARLKFVGGKFDMTLQFNLTD